MALVDGTTSGNGTFPFIWMYNYNKLYSRSKASRLMPYCGFGNKSETGLRIVNGFMFGKDYKGTPLNNYQFVKSKALTSETIR